MAIEILKKNNIIHEVHHDLESFYWVLVWLVLRHTKFTHPMGHNALQTIFGGDRPSSGLLKGGWITDQDELTVDGNEPLNILLQKFRRRCMLNYARIERMTYDNVVEIFKEVLGRDDWPSNDKALPYRPTSAPQAGASQYPHQARPEASIESARIDFLQRASREHSGSAEISSRQHLSYEPIARMSVQRGVHSESALMALQSRLPLAYAGTIKNVLSKESIDDSTNRTQVSPVMLHNRGVSDSASLLLQSSFFPDPESPSPLPRVAGMKPNRDTFLRQSRARERSVTPDSWDDVEPHRNVFKRLSEVDSRPASSRAGSPPSHLSTPPRGGSSDRGSRGVDPGHSTRKRSRSLAEQDESEAGAGPSKRSRTRSYQSFRASTSVHATPKSRRIRPLMMTNLPAAAAQHL